MWTSASLEQGHYYCLIENTAFSVRFNEDPKSQAMAITQGPVSPTFQIQYQSNSKVINNNGKKLKNKELRVVADSKLPSPRNWATLLLFLDLTSL